MRVVVAGAGVIGFPITKMLVENKHDVVVIDIDRDVCETIYADTGAMAIHGSATDIWILLVSRVFRHFSSIKSAPLHLVE